MNTEQKALTPLMKQYQDIKKLHPDEILFFRLGDFYEMFQSDAKEASAILGLALTARNGHAMCGIPHHSSSNYIAKLLKAGKKVALCEQVSEPTAGVKLVERKVVRVITPGTVLEDDMLDSKNSNHLVSIYAEDNGWGLSCLDVSTGQFWVSQNNKDKHYLSLSGALSKTNVTEILIDKESYVKLKSKVLIPDSIVFTHTRRLTGNIIIPKHWAGEKVWEDKKLALKSAISAYDYVSKNEQHIKDFLIPTHQALGDYLVLDQNAVRTLELVKTEAGRKNSLWHTLDNTKTPMGSRTLKSWILNPLLDIRKISKRQQSVEHFVKDENCRAKIFEILRTVSDIERISARISAFRASPRDVAGLKRSLETITKFKNWLSNYGENFEEIKENFAQVYAPLQEVFVLLEKAIEDEPPIKIADGKIIKQGYHPELDELRNLKANSATTLNEICERERARTNIPKLKIGYNSVFGYYIEVGKANVSKVPYDYVRKQTLTSAERFITEELKTIETKILNAEDRISKLETFLFDEIKKFLTTHIHSLKTFATCLAELDTYNSLAIASVKGNYTKPKVNGGADIQIVKGRHPVVEVNLPTGKFVANDLNIGNKDPQILMITGPNMGGKSVYLRQNALLVIMAQIGSFIPAESATIGIVDKIMTRIGAQDALNRGESTFMVEMKETANILHSATEKSLILLDEVGRGTSTFDGISIAGAITEFLYKPKGGPKVLFATHYFELTELENKYKGIKNYHVEAQEYQNSDGETELAFLYEVREGSADKSYGIHVAELAGLSPSCILRAKKVLKDLETKSDINIIKREKNHQNDLFSAPLLEEIKLADPEKLTPLQALELIGEWKKRLSDNE